MKKIALLVLLLAGCSSMWIDDYAPKIGTQIVIVETTTQTKVINKCGSGSDVRGCAIKTKDFCRVYSIKSNCTLFHEIKHCLGWEHPRNYSECN